MASKKSKEVGLNELRWLTKSEAMAWVRRLSESKFDEEFGNKVTRYLGPRGFLYDKRELDRLQESMIEIAGSR